MQFEFYQDLFAPFGHITTRKMFGVAGIYCDGLFFAIVADDELWLKVDDVSRAAFEEAGAEQYVFEMKKKSTHIPYYRAPEDIFDDEDSLHHWTQLALNAALRNRKPSKKKRQDH
ncbi:MAG: competence protein TfoX [Cellvibrionaceae bacterium]|nr:competence protein TfoX [Cellvibrionaceae bacterium]|tara:strand:+ start:286 stop:630 length:345 start_codon:yes stop_codon:yes gene_type:complete